MSENVRFKLTQLASKYSGDPEALERLLDHLLSSETPVEWKPGKPEVSDYARGRAQVIACQCWEDQNKMRRKAGAPEIEMDQGIVDAFALALAVWIETACKAEDKLAFLKSKGLTVGPMKEAGKEPYLAYVIESWSELCDLETVNKLTDAEIRADSWEQMAAQYSGNADHWRGVLQACYEQLPDEMKRRACMDDEGEVAAEPHLSNLPDVVKFMANLAYIWIPGELTEQGAQSVLDECIKRLNKSGFGFVADGTVHGNGIFVDRLRARAIDTSGRNAELHNENE